MRTPHAAHRTYDDTRCYEAVGEAFVNDEALGG